MLIRKPSDIPSSEITSESNYKEFLSRRRFLRTAVSGAAAAGGAIIGADRIAELVSPGTTALADATKLQTVKKD